MKVSILKFSIATILFFISTHLSAQNVELYLGETVKSSGGESLQILSKGEQGLITYKTDRGLFKIKDRYLDIYDEKMNLVSSNEIELPDEDLNINRFIVLDSEIFVFMTKYDKDKDINSIYGTTISSKGEFNDDIIEIAQVKVEKRKEMNGFEIDLSEDSTKFLISITPPYKDDVDEQINFIVLDKEFRETDNMLIKFPFSDEDFYLYDYLLDDYGNVHLLGLVSIEESRRKILFKRSRVLREARLFSFYKDNEEVKEYELGVIEDDAGYLSQITMKTDDLGRLQCSGFYSDNKGNSMKGIFVFTLNIEERAIEKVSSQEFTDEYIEQFLSDRQIRKKKRKKEKNKDSRFDELYNFKIRDLVMKDGGGFYVLAEYYLFYVTSSTDANGNTTYTNHYVYKDLMIINVLKDNTVTWFTRIPKFQHTRNDGGIYSGIAYGRNSDNSLSIIFNDHEKNAPFLSPEKMKNLSLRKAKTVLVNIDSEGNATKTPLLDSKNAKTVVMPQRHLQCDLNDIVIYAAMRRRNRLINVILK